VEQLVKAVFIGAGARASRVHHPIIASLPGVRIEAVCDLDDTKANAAADRYGVERRYTDYRRMLEEVAADVAYVIMPPMGLAPVVIDCLNAGTHVFMEKPPGMNSAEVEAMVEAAERNARLTMVGLQRRFCDVVQEARRLVAERSQPTLCLGEFHKCRLQQSQPTYSMSDLMLDVIHIVDLVRYLCGGEVVEAKSYCDSFFAPFTTNYNALLRFDNGAVGIITANRSTGGRKLRMELHGRGVAAYADIPERLEVHRDNEHTPIVLTGRELAQQQGEDDWEGTKAAHKHFLECIRGNRQPLTALQDVIRTVRLVELLERSAG
jgi:virulence factor